MAQDELRKGGTQPADKSLINRRLKAHPVPVPPIVRILDLQPIGAGNKYLRFLPLTKVIRVH